ncbi:hypothetical protein TP70_09640 [Staphylococcus microti]|uniref:Fluoride-specific ion channel FluC n=1 Tax=Staphylococcus microti TaxID=569857 RepID=A0A0D6XPG7_9STAP|nr:CrcB family protein [Staphylococcus microti]KIX90136.1 hypothetical protein TP70_09640 [Staphylococcus microti]PNZ79911.1 CrcB family protein [Staphylococcus microti]SUM57803.1 CrcB-like protein [Staphylococcus microti]
MNLLLVLLGGGIGATARAYVADVCASFYHQSFPIATLIVNLIGSGLIGLCGGLLVAHTPLHALFVIGFLGGLTTFSTVQLELVQMIQKRQLGQWISYSFLQYACCFGCCYIGTLLI